jgi:hypothetical protein
MRGSRPTVLAVVAGLAVALGGCSSGTRYTYWSNPCVTSRISTGDWQQQGMARGVALDGAAMYCSYGASFDDTRVEAYGIGPNTSGWDWHGVIPGVPSAPATTRPAATTAADPRAAAQQDCKTVVNALNDLAGPLAHHDAAGVVAAGKAALAAESKLGNDLRAAQYPTVIDSAAALLGDVGDAGQAALNFEDYGQPWSDVTARESRLASDFRALDPACSAVGVTVDLNGSRPAATPSHSPVTVPSPAPNRSSSPDPDSTGCPTSAQLLLAWNQAPQTARLSWTPLTPTAFEGTTGWNGWVVTNPIVNANGTVIFTETNRQLSLLPETRLSKFDAAVCGVSSAPAAWSNRAAGPANCP